MSVAAPAKPKVYDPPAPDVADVVLLGQRLRRIRREEYHRLAEQDLSSTTDSRPQHTELIAGAVIDMAPKRDTHSVANSLVGRALRGIFDEEHYWVRIQEPLNFRHSEPEPDVSVVEGEMRSWVGRDHPTTALLVVEVSDSTLAFDRRIKNSLYAAHGVPDYWIVNLIDRRLEVYRQPVDDPTHMFGKRYADVRNVAPADEVRPLAMPDKPVRVADLLP